MEKERIYFVIDMKSFFASVECAERGFDPMDTPLVVADKERSETTICLAVSPKLKQMGVHNRCRLYEIPKNIEYIIAKPHMKNYINYAAEIYGIYLKYIDKNDIYVYSIDECFIDATDYLKLYKLTPRNFAKKLMREIKETLGIPSSTGIGTNLYLAKIALDITAKHNSDSIGFLDEETFLYTLSHHTPLSDFWGISHGTIARLEKLGIKDMAGIRNMREEILYREFGINAELLIDHAYGKETTLMSDIKSYKPKSKSLSTSQILPCNYNYLDAKNCLKEMIESGSYELARAHAVTSLFHIFVSYGDNRGEGVHGTIRMPVTTNLSSVILPYALKSYDEIVDRDRPIRKIGYDFSELRDESEESYDLFTDTEKLKREAKLTKSLLHIKDTFGKNAILKGNSFLSGATQRERNELIGGHHG